MRTGFEQYKTPPAMLKLPTALFQAKKATLRSEFQWVRTSVSKFTVRDLKKNSQSGTVTKLSHQLDIDHHDANFKNRPYFSYLGSGHPHSKTGLSMSIGPRCPQRLGDDIPPAIGSHCSIPRHLKKLVVSALPPDKV